MPEKVISIREQLEAEEEKNLSPYAQLSSKTRGRSKPISLCLIRTEYQRDRDRIIHTKSFRRLSHKTQVFLAPEGDHYRTRLTHTLEVTQISRTIARALKLNEDLTEAIAMGHDLGHTPFGHIGEEALTKSLKAVEVTGKYKNLPIPFKHNHQSLRVIDLIEYNGKGLNLTEEVRDGILNHTGKDEPITLEGKIVRKADRIAYINHDIDDALRGKVISFDDLPSEPIRLLGEYTGQRINSLVQDMVEASFGKPDILLSEPYQKAMDTLRNFLFSRVYNNSDAKGEDPKAVIVINKLFQHFMENPTEIPPEFLEIEKVLPVAVCDYIAGMTDRYAIKVFEKIFVPKAWKD